MRRSFEYKNANDKATGMNTLSSCIGLAARNGYTDNFRVDKGMLTSRSGKRYSPADIHIVINYRFEGESDPGDNSILYLIETEDGQKGTLINAYGTYADENVNNFILEVDKVHKKSAS